MFSEHFAPFLRRASRDSAKEAASRKTQHYFGLRDPERAKEAGMDIPGYYVGIGEIGRAELGSHDFAVALEAELERRAQQVVQHNLNDLAPLTFEFVGYAKERKMLLFRARQLLAE